MEYTGHPWYPMWIGMAIITASSFLIFALPETLHLRKESPSTPSSAWTSPNSNSHEKMTWRSHVRALLLTCATQAKESAVILKSPSVFLLLLTFITHMFGASAEQFSMQYVSKRFHWPLSDTGYLVSMAALVNVLLLLVILPLLSTLLTSPRFSFRMPTPKKDLFLARLSILINALGAIIFAGPTTGFAVVGLIVFTLGHGFSPLVRSTLTTLIDQQHIARLYSLITIVDTLGGIAAGPVLPWLFSIGLKLRGKEGGGGEETWLALPYFGSAAVCIVTAIMTFLVTLPKPRDPQDVERSELPAVMKDED